tara:strand:+ start:6909 stop:7529 length:621 start_codon:yes stop_codon:yes gene_type:complete
MTILTKQPTWGNVYQLWNQQDVPEVQIIDFELDNHFTRLPWFNLIDDKQIITSNPQNITAMHLANRLIVESEEFRAAYMITAFLIQVGSLDFQNAILDPVWLRYGHHRFRWWHPNAMSILPSVETSRFSRTLNDAKRRYYNPAWEEFIEAAAKIWKDIAIGLAIVRVPELMCRDTMEYQSYQQRLQLKFDEDDRKNYQRIRLKFDN